MRRRTSPTAEPHGTGGSAVGALRGRPSKLRAAMSSSLGRIVEPAREIDVVHRTDVLVVGAGPGGLAAALAASRAGAEVTLLERFGCFGGNLTVVGVEGLAWYRHEETVEAGGIGREFEVRAREMGAAVRDRQSL